MQRDRGDWHPADIKAALAKRGYTFARIAREEGLCPTSPNAVLFKTWRRIERAVARILGTPPESIWPSRYRSSNTIITPPARRANV